MILYANFTHNQNEVTTDELFQWDTGQQLCIEGLTGIDASTEVHFANNRMIQAIVKTGTFDNSALTVDIPNEFLQNGGGLYGKAWVYVTESNAVGRTIKTIKIPIVPRTRPNDYVSPADPDSKGIVEQALEILRDGTKVSYVTDESVSNAVETGKVYYTEVGSSKALIVPVSSESIQAQFRLDRDGKIYSRRRSRLTTESPFPAWGSFVDISAGVDPEVIREIVLQYLEEHGIDLTGVERTANRVNVVNTQSDDEHYPTAGAVYDYAAPKSGLSYLNNQLNQLTNEVNQKANTSDIPDISGKADKATTLGGYGITDAYIKSDINMMFNQVDVDLQGKADKSTTLAGYGITDGEMISHKVTAITSGANNTMYPSALAVYNALSGKESTSNKSTSVGSGSSHTQYPTSKAVYDYVTTVIQGKADKTDTYTKSEVDAAIQTAVGTIETQLSQV